MLISRCVIARFTAVCLMALLNACSSTGGLAPAVEEREDEGFYTAPARLPAMKMPPATERYHRQRNPAAESLLEKARQSERGGDINSAVAQVERALRIDPRNPEAYYQLASYRLKQGQASEALQLANKALNLEPDSSSMATRIWQLVALCHDYLGDEEAADRARLKAERIR